MSMRPIDLQTVVPRVTEVARVDRVGQQDQEKAAAEAARQNQEAARKGNEEVPQTRSAEQREVTLRKEGDKDRRSLRRGQRQGGGRQAGTAGDATGEAEDGGGVSSDLRAAGPGPDEPGQKLDIRV